MRMHTHGKCTPNILLGPLLVFCVIVLYNYWTVSTINQDLIAKVHNLEERIIAISKTNDALQANLEKVEEIKEKVEGNLKKEQRIDEQAKEEITRKDNEIDSLKNELENSKQAAQNCRDELTAAESQTQLKNKERSELKTKIVSLEAQLVEKSNSLSRVEKELQLQQQRGVNFSSSTPKSISLGAKVMPAPAIEIAQQQHDILPVLMSDPAVPYPKGWMEPRGSVSLVKNVVVKAEGDSGIKRNRSMGPVIIFDPPNRTRKKARFSVLDPPKNEMNAGGGGGPFKQAESLQRPFQQEENAHGGEDFGPHAGVLPAPGHRDRGDQQQQQHKMDNLDAAEDDGDHQMKDDFGDQADQSPDGALSHKDNNGNIDVQNRNADPVRNHQPML